MLIRLIRHGMTAGNRTSSYIGRTDEPLTEEGAAGVLEKKRMTGLSARKSGMKTWWMVSPMLRCLQTAFLLAEDDAETSAAFVCSLRTTDSKKTAAALTEIIGTENIQIEPRMRECDFGSFEGKNYRELTGNPDYQAWIDSGGILPFPGGEAPEDFKNRCCEAFADLIARIEKMKNGSTVTEKIPDIINIVVHGGTIMSILERYAVNGDGKQLAYYEWHTENACGFEMEAAPEDFTDPEKKRITAVKWG